MYLVRVVGTVGEIERGVEALLSAPDGVDPEVTSLRPLPGA
jgi:hypothetical protein